MLVQCLVGLPDTLGCPARFGRGAYVSTPGIQYKGTRTQTHCVFLQAQEAQNNQAAYLLLAMWPV